MTTPLGTIQTPLIHEHHAASVLVREYAGCILPEVFSNFEKEYAAARDQVALFDTNWHAIFELTGRDRIKYLHAVTTNNIQGLEEGRGTLALLLNPQGRILAELEIYKLPERVLLRCHASVRERTLATLEKYIISSDVKIEDMTDKLGSMAIEGRRAPVIVSQACGVKLADMSDLAIKEVTIGHTSCRLVRRSHFGMPGAEFIARRDVLPSLWRKLLAAVEAHGGAAIGMETLNVLRLEAGVPWFGVDFSDAVIPHEADVVATHISFTKGCYTGQEIVERVRSRGHVNRKRVTLKFSTAEPPLAGTKLHTGGVDVGYVTSAAFSPAAGSSIGMGYLRREQFAPGSVVHFDGGKAEVTAPPDRPEAGSLQNGPE